ncbi:MAG: hypothetical protein ACPG31_06895 [Planctomycetota bacterium]
MGKTKGSSLRDVPPPRDFNPRNSFSTRQLPGGSPVFDKVFPCSIGFAIGCSISFYLVLGSPEALKFSTGGFHHPLFNGAIFGFVIGTLLSPIALWLKKGKDNSGILWVSIVLGLLLGFAFSAIG